MSKVRFILGRAGAGKTRFVLDKIARELRKSPLEGRPIVLLVPEQSSYYMERTLAGWRSLRGFSRAKVFSFNRLVQSIASKVEDISKRLLLFSSRKVILKGVLLALRDELRYWRDGTADSIAGSMLKMIDEILASDLDIDDLERRLEDPSLDRVMSDKLHDIVLIYKTYRRCEGGSFIDLRRELRRYLEKVDSLSCLEGAELYVDGFSGFTGQEYSLLLKVIKKAKIAYITLCVDPEILIGKGRNKELFYRSFGPTEKTYDRLVRLFRTEKIEIGPPIILKEPDKRRFKDARLLSLIEKSLAHGCVESVGDFNEGLGLADYSGEIKLVEAEDPFFEAELVAGKILELVRDRNYRFRDISVILRRQDEFTQILTHTFDRYGIPYFLDLKRPIDRHPLARLILSALKVIESGFASEWVISFAKTGLAPISLAEADMLEDYALSHGVDSEAWLGEWQSRIDELLGEDEDIETSKDIGTGTINRQRLEDINDARRRLIAAIGKLASFIGWSRDLLGDLKNIEGLRDKALGADKIVDGILDFLKYLRVADKLSRFASFSSWEFDLYLNRRVFDIITEILDQMKVIFSGEYFRLGEFYDLLKECFKTQTVGVIPSCIDQVMIGTIDRSRQPNVKACFVVHYNEGSWPAPLQEDIVLTDKERRFIGCEDLQLTADIREHLLREMYLNYIALTRPSEYLWISYSVVDRTGRRLRPSRFLNHIAHLVAPLKVEVKSLKRISNLFTDVIVDSDQISLKEKIAPLPFTKYRIARDLILAVAGSKDKDKDYSSDSCDNYDVRDDSHCDEGSNRELSDIRKGSFTLRSDLRRLVERFVSTVAAFRDTRVDIASYRDLYDRSFSFSQIESYYRCPFQHFCRYGLRIRPQERYMLSPELLGVFRHKVLRDVWQSILSLEGSLPGEDVIERLVGDAILRNKAEARSSIFDQPRNAFIIGLIKDELVASVIEQIRYLSCGRFRPRYLEKEFDTEIEGIRLRGRVDRIDIADGSVIFVIDYKSGFVGFSKEELNAGVNMQLVGYLMSLLTMPTFKDMRPAGAIAMSLKPTARGKGKISGVISKEALDFFISDFDGAGYITEDGGQIDKKANQHMSQDALREIKPYNIRIRKDGELYETSKEYVIPYDELVGMIGKVRELILNYVENIKKGDIRVLPVYRRSGNKGYVCKLCSYGSICRFIKGLYPYRIC